MLEWDGVPLVRAAAGPGGHKYIPGAWKVKKFHGLCHSSTP
jgi:hypothetical protein